MNCRILALCLLAFATLFPNLSAQAENGMAIAPEVCLECHDDVVTPVAYGASVHGTNACTSCHTTVTSLDAHMSGDVMPEAQNVYVATKRKPASITQVSTS